MIETGPATILFGGPACPVLNDICYCRNYAAFQVVVFLQVVIAKVADANDADTDVFHYRQMPRCEF
jgi:hypothetical protein